jgi:hypothetical protein
MPSPCPSFPRLCCLLPLCAARAALAQYSPSEPEPTQPAPHEPELPWSPAPTPGELVEPSPALPSPANPDVDLGGMEAALAQDAVERAEDAGPAGEPALDSAPTNMNPDLSIILDTALAYFSKDEKSARYSRPGVDYGPAPGHGQRCRPADGIFVEPLARLVRHTHVARRGDLGDLPRRRARGRHSRSAHILTRAF